LVAFPETGKVPSEGSSATIRDEGEGAWSIPDDDGEGVLLCNGGEGGEGAWGEVVEDDGEGVEVGKVVEDDGEGVEGGEVDGEGIEVEDGEGVNACDITC